MYFMHSIVPGDFDNRPVDASRIRKIELSRVSRHRERLYVIGFYDSTDRELYSWFYACDQQRNDDLRLLLRINPLTLIFLD